MAQVRKRAKWHAPPMPFSKRSTLGRNSDLTVLLFVTTARMAAMASVNHDDASSTSKLAIRTLALEIRKVNQVPKTEVELAVFEDIS